MTLAPAPIAFDYREYTLKDIFDALKKNGFEHLREAWFSSEDGSKGGCVLGQALLNLNSVSPDIDEAEAQVEDDEEYGLLHQLNKFSYEGDKWNHYSFEDEIDGEVTTQEFFLQGNQLNLGNLIIHWNDLRLYNLDGDDYYYPLETYEQVVEMAYDVLSPHFDEKVKLLHYG